MFVWVASALKSEKSKHWPQYSPRALSAECPYEVHWQSCALHQHQAGQGICVSLYDGRGE